MGGLGRPSPATVGRWRQPGKGDGSEDDGPLRLRCSMRPVRPPRLVEVFADDVWRPGFLEAWRRDGDNWVAYVR